MSELGRLFRWKGSATVEPLENFTTEALAIAIGYDDRPIKLALRRVVWSPRAVAVHPALQALESGDVTDLSLTASTQVPIAPVAGIPPGYLDLVLRVRRGVGEETEVWVEVKVDAWETGNQLEVYRQHAERHSAPPAIITLGRTSLKRSIPFLTWSQVIEAIGCVEHPHHAWLRLKEFLLDQEIVRPPVSPDSVDKAACVKIVVDVNRKLRSVWPGKGWLAWVDGTLRHSLIKYDDLVASAGPLRFGLVTVEEKPEWRLALTTGKNWAKVKLDPDEAVHDADAAGLPTDWHRDPSSLYVLQRRLPHGRLTSHDDIVAWFEEGLRQLHDAKLLDRYFAGVAEKHGHAPEPTVAGS